MCFIYMCFVTVSCSFPWNFTSGKSLSTGVRMSSCREDLHLIQPVLSEQYQTRTTLCFLLDFLDNIWIWTVNPDKHWLLVVNSEGTSEFPGQFPCCPLLCGGLFLILLTLRKGPTLYRVIPWLYLSWVPMPCKAIRWKLKVPRALKTLSGWRPALVLAYQPVFLLPLYSEFCRFVLYQLGDTFKIKCCLIKIVVVKIAISIEKAIQGTRSIALLGMKHLLQGWDWDEGNQPWQTQFFISSVPTMLVLKCLYLKGVCCLRERNMAINP